VATLHLAVPGAAATSPVLVIFGCNGSIWLQRDASGVVEPDQHEAAGNNNNSGGPELVELHQQQQEVHAATSYALEDRRMICRLSNSIQILVTAKVMCTVQHLEILYQVSQAYTPAQMLQPKVVVELAALLKERLQK
jgi:hypothetical protein